MTGSRARARPGARVDRINFLEGFPHFRIAEWAILALHKVRWRSCQISIVCSVEVAVVI